MGRGWASGRRTEADLAPGSLRSMSSMIRFTIEIHGLESCKGTFCAIHAAIASGIDRVFFSNFLTDLHWTGSRLCSHRVLATKIILQGT